MLTLFIVFCLLVYSCKNSDDKKPESNSSKDEIQKLEEIKKEKQTESDSLKREIEKLKRQRDSLNAAGAEK